jgi:hypothetical protein
MICFKHLKNAVLYEKQLWATEAILSHYDKC